MTVSHFLRMPLFEILFVQLIFNTPPYRQRSTAQLDAQPNRQSSDK